MTEAALLHELVHRAASRVPEGVALTVRGQHSTYAELADAIECVATGLVGLGLQRGERAAVYLEKRIENVAAIFGASAAGGAFVPLNPLLKPAQVAYILRDCNVRVLVTSPERFAQLEGALADCGDLRHVVVTGATLPPGSAVQFSIRSWSELTASRGARGHRVIDTDLAAILYTSGSTGRPKGVVLSHRNMVAGAKSVASYLENTTTDTLLAVLPLSFDAGFSQLTTAFHAGARVVLLNYLLPQDVIRALAQERVTGLTAVPPLYMQLVQAEWPAGIDEHLRYFANTGGRMPLETLTALRRKVPRAKPFLMYGLTEAFRSTYLPPEEVDRRPDSIGKAIPNAEILVLRDDGSPCEPDEPGELVHRGALVGMGYWNDAAKTAERYKVLPGREAGFVLPEIAVFSGDTVRRDRDGYLYFIGRRDEMIKTSGYRVSPTEIEEVLYDTGHVGEAAAFGIAHETLGQAIVAVVTAKGTIVEPADLIAACRARLPAYMIPTAIHVSAESLPRNPNGKIDRRALATEYAERDASAVPSA
jgi:acyl-CoA ligase (AMP-forming) (exosortase A-associated)